MATPRVLVLRAAGTNCDSETAYAFEREGASAEVAHVNRLADGTVSLDEFQILAVPGGFSYGDDIGAGRVFAVELERRIGDQLVRFVDRGGLAIGICNGFQVLVKTGLLPGNKAYSHGEAVTLAGNDSQKYEDRWVRLRVEETGCAWLSSDAAEPEIELPIAHAEGRFLPASEKVLDELRSNRQIVLRYVSADGGEAAYPANPNGSTDGIAGITDPSGRVLGLMPHPERYIFRRQHPTWTRGDGREGGDGSRFFRNAVRVLS